MRSVLFIDCSLSISLLLITLYAANQMHQTKITLYYIIYWGEKEKYFISM